MCRGTPVLTGPLYIRNHRIAKCTIVHWGGTREPEDSSPYETEIFRVPPFHGFRFPFWGESSAKPSHKRPSPCAGIALESDSRPGTSLRGMKTL